MRPIILLLNGALLAGAHDIKTAEDANKVVADYRLNGVHLMKDGQRLGVIDPIHLEHVGVYRVLYG